MFEKKKWDIPLSVTFKEPACIVLVVISLSLSIAPRGSLLWLHSFPLLKAIVQSSCGHVLCTIPIVEVPRAAIFMTLN